MIALSSFARQAGFVRLSGRGYGGQMTANT
jgi:hypothetical protein